ncbi:MAG: prepilin peptidase [Candidatus Omnitrophica bacterium]|nr:prepilin peptidase [Candidatus Omnitrophota bacterium]
MELAVVLGLAVACALDWRFKKLPNWLTFSIALSGFIFHMMRGGLPAFMQSILGFMVGIACLYLPFLLGGVGGGDVKLLGAIGAYVGPVVVIQVFLVSAVIGGVLSMLEITRTRAWPHTLESLRNRVLHFILTRQVVSERQVQFSKEPLRIPYALALSAGYLWIQFIGGGG